jgi:hypothetical protein
MIEAHTRLIERSFEESEFGLCLQLSFSLW